jgi:hypothetical protein
LKKQQQKDALLENIGVIQIKNVKRFPWDIMLGVEDILFTTTTTQTRMTELEKMVTAMVATVVIAMAVVEMVEEMEAEENETLD